MDSETVILGAEHDDALRLALQDVLVDLGVKLRDKSWGVGGSQVIETWDVEIEGQRLLIEGETYMGLSITGPSPLVQRVRDMVQQRLTAGGGKR